MNAENYDDRFWQEGIAGNCNIVCFNGEDIRPVAYVEDAAMRARLIAKHNDVVRMILQPNGQN